ncbi:hypothetical protein ACHAXS_014420 [Conticribra weissflogii]
MFPVTPTPSQSSSESGDVASALAIQKLSNSKDSTEDGMAASSRSSQTTISSTYPMKMDNVSSSSTLYVGILMERPQHIQNSNNSSSFSFSWGFSITKENTKYAMVVGIHSPNTTSNGPLIKWCQITNRVPSPSIVFSASKSSSPTDDFEKFLMKKFPAPIEYYSSTPAIVSIDNSTSQSAPVEATTIPQTTFSPSLTSRILQPGDAIISVNGLPASTFPSVSAMASFIRTKCNDKLQIVAMREEKVWKAAWDEIVSPRCRWSGNQLSDQRSRVSQVVGAAWQSIFVVRTSSSIKSSNFGKNLSSTRPAVTNFLSRPIPKDVNTYKIKKRKEQRHQTTSQKIPKKLKFDKNDTSFHLHYLLADTRNFLNQKFTDDNGNPIPYCDNSEFDINEGTRIRRFINDEVDKNFHEWLNKRKATWRSFRKERHPPQTRKRSVVDDDGDDEDEAAISDFNHDFWLSSGYDTFEEWLSASKLKWKRSYSWHKDRRKKLELDCEKEVHFPMVPSSYVKPTIEGNATIFKEFENWLEVRKKHWLVLRRKRQRALSEDDATIVPLKNYVDGTTSTAAADQNLFVKQSTTQITPSLRRTNRVSSSPTDVMYIDEILADQEQRNSTNIDENRGPLDISWLFDSQLGAPDDIIVVIMQFLNPSDHGKLLCLSWTTNFTFKKRDHLWQTLCPSHWILPRRPRKSWCVIYVTKIREEEELSRKQSDDLLLKANNVIDKGDQLGKIEKLVRKAEKDFGFSVDYTSGIVLERNSLLNMAVISGRHKIAKWLIEEKGADIESCDRGDFTPLCNAAWDGDKYMVRYLLGKGANRKKVGTGHSSHGLAPASFQGLTAERWARKSGHEEVAELIRLGL